jgi:hypothetical protein
MKTVRILLQEFRGAVDHVRARPGQFPVSKSGQLEILLSDLFTEEYQIRFVGQYLTRNKYKWLENCCRIAKSTRNTKLILQMTDGAIKASVIDIDSFILQGVLNQDWETAGTSKSKAASDIVASKSSSATAQYILDDTLSQLKQLRKEHDALINENVKLHEKIVTVQDQSASREEVRNRARLSAELYKSKWDADTLMKKNQIHQMSATYERRLQRKDNKFDNLQQKANDIDSFVLRDEGEEFLTLVNGRLAMTLN